MKQINLIQGTPEWKAHRATHFNASDAPAMMSKSKYVSRSQLLHQMATGQEEEINEATQRLFDRGHDAEAAIRPHIEALINDELFPVTGVSEEHEGLSASFDGLTLMEDINFEHKLWNESLAERVRDNDLEEHYLIQMDQQMLVSGAEKTIFVVSDGTPDKMEYCWVAPSADRQKAIIAGWGQFQKDLESYEAPEAEPVVEEKAIKELPALFVEVSGQVNNSNLPAVKNAVQSFIDAINTNLQTDQDFADAEQTVKFCDKAEKQLELVKQQSLDQTADISDLFRTIDDLKEQMRQKRLYLNKEVKAQKDARKKEIKQKAQDAFSAHMRALGERIGTTVIMPFVALDIDEAMKGKRTISSLQDAASSALVQSKIEANAIADKIDANLKVISSEGSKYPFLFVDTQQLALKDTNDLKELVRARITSHEAAEKRKQEERQNLVEKREAAKPVGESPDKTATPAQSKKTTIVQPESDRPTDSEIIEVLALHYKVHESKVITWLLDMDLDEANNDLAANF